MPWQRLVLDVALECDPATGLLDYETVVLTVPRQQGKSLMLRVVELLHAVRRPGTMIYKTAQSRQDAKDRWEDSRKAVDRSALGRLVSSVRTSNGSERLDLHNGSSIRVFAPTAQGAHGATIDVGVLDEAWRIPWHVVHAILPAMQTRPDPQLWIVSTAGDDLSEMLRYYVERGRSECCGDDRGPFAFFEWSAGDELDPDDPETWASCMPALGHTTTIERIAGQHAVLPRGEFERAYLNRWTMATERVIPADAWDRCSSSSVALDARARPMFFFDVAHDRSATAIVAGGGDPPILELVDYRPGTEWVPARLLELRDKWRPVAIGADNLGPAGNVASACELAGLDVVRLSSLQMAEACGDLYDGVVRGSVGIRKDAAGLLDAAAAAAVARAVGDRWVWDRRSTSSTDIAPLVAATGAHWLVVNRPGSGIYV